MTVRSHRLKFSQGRLQSIGRLLINKTSIFLFQLSMYQRRCSWTKSTVTTQCCLEGQLLVTVLIDVLWVCCTISQNFKEQLVIIVWCDPKTSLIKTSAKSFRLLQHHTSSRLVQDFHKSKLFFNRMLQVLVKVSINIPCFSAVPQGLKRADSKPGLMF